MQSKSFLNNSFNYANKFNKSRSLLKNSVLRCTLKANNIELARALGERGMELTELKNEHNRLLHENYDLVHNNRFRAYNYENFMSKFDDLSKITISLYDQVCKLSDSLIELQNHPLVTCEQSDNACDMSKVPSPFMSRDKIARSPLQASNCVDNTHSNSSVDNLASKIDFLKEKSLHTILNLSTNLSAAISSRKDLKIHANGADKEPPPVINKSFSKLNVTRQKRNKFSINNILNEDTVTHTKPRKTSKTKDPMYSLTKPKKKTTRKNKLQIERKLPNKEEYIKNKEQDAFYLSQNETVNVTVVPPTLNEFKGQLCTEAVKISQGGTDDRIATTVDIDSEKIITPHVDTEIVGTKLTKHLLDDDDDFILPKKKIIRSQKKIDDSKLPSSKRGPKKKTLKEKEPKPKKSKTNLKFDENDIESKKQSGHGFLNELAISPIEKISKKTTIPRKTKSSKIPILHSDDVLNLVGIEGKENHPEKDQGNLNEPPDELDGLIFEVENNDVADMLGQNKRRRPAVNYRMSPINKKKRRNN